jgi:hypothetical protein
MNKYIIHDNVLPPELLNQVFEWALNQEYYAEHFWTRGAKNESENVWPLPIPLPVNFNPRRDRGDKQESGPWLGSVKQDIPMNLLMRYRTGLYRHPIGWSDATVQAHSPLIWTVFQHLNETLFNGTATLDQGIGEGIAMFGTPGEFQDIPMSKTWEDYGLTSDELIALNNGPGWNCFINARHHNYGYNTYHLRASHKDSEMDAINENREHCYSVLINLNPHWLPKWEGELLLNDETITGEVSPATQLNVGWPKVISPHIPGRVMIYDHRVTHSTNRPNGHADNLAYKLAFRLHATSVKGL